MEFPFVVNKSFLGQPDHPITVKKASHADLLKLIGALHHQQRSILMVSTEGVECDATVRHSQRGGTDYYQFNCRDHEVTGFLSLNDSVTVQVANGARGVPEVRLLLH